MGKANTGVKKKVGNWAKASSFEHHQAFMEGKPCNSLQYRFYTLMMSANDNFAGLPRRWFCRRFTKPLVSSEPRGGTPALLLSLMMCSSISSPWTCQSRWVMVDPKIEEIEISQESKLLTKHICFPSLGYMGKVAGVCKEYLTFTLY